MASFLCFNDLELVQPTIVNLRFDQPFQSKGPENLVQSPTLLKSVGFENPAKGVEVYRQHSCVPRALCRSLKLFEVFTGFVGFDARQ